MTTEAERRYEIDNLIAEDGLEGIKYDDPTLALFERYVSAELTWDEMCVLWNQLADELLKTYERLPE